MLVSIIITSYNYDKYIRECIDSCLNQTFDDYEIIVVNDGSTDSTKKILEDYINNEKIKIFNNTNSGIEKASNFGILKAIGKYIVRVDADDKLEKNFLKELVSIIKLKQVSFVYSNYWTIDENSNILNKIVLPEFSKTEIMNRGDFLATGTLYSKEILQKMGLYNESSINCGLENYELIIKLLLKDYKGYLVDKPLFYYRRHSSNISLQKKDKIISYGNNLFNNLNLGNYTTNKFHPYGLVLDD